MRLFRLAIFLSLLLTSLTGAIVIISRRQPANQRIAMLRLTDCAPPCWIRIVPGTTTLDEAKSRISQVFNKTSGVLLQTEQETPGVLQVNLKHQNDPLFSLGIKFETHTSRNDTPIESILFHLWGPSFVLADLWNVVGTPDTVWVSSHYIFLIYPASTIDVLPSARISWSQYPVWFEFYKVGPIPSQPLRGERPWRGFTTLANYGLKPENP
jgi:hypothetical protein